MSLKQKMTERGVTSIVVDKAVENIEKVLATVVMNASKNTTGAQAMKGNASSLAADLEVLYRIQKEYAEAEKADKAAVNRARKIEKPKDEEASEVSEADKG